MTAFERPNTRIESPHRMTVALLFVLALVAALLAWKWRRFGISLGIATSVVFLITGYGWPAQALLHNLQDGFDTEAHEWGIRNAIILLGGGSELSDRHAVETGIFGFSRLVKTVQMYRACTAEARECKVIVSGGDAHGFGTSEAEVFSAQLVSLGVPLADVLVEARSRNTWQNAQFSAAFFEHHRFDRVFLVSSGVHLRRARLYFAHFGIPATPIRSDYGRPLSAALPTAYNFLLTDVALHEYIGIWRYHVYNALGWNAKPQPPRVP
jgi:uncharacterized SAM-binding protein YcdF (DUF218 family)